MLEHRKIITSRDGLTWQYYRDEDGRWWVENTDSDPDRDYEPYLNPFGDGFEHDTVKRLTLKDGTLYESADDYERKVIVTSSGMHISMVKLEDGLWYYEEEDDFSDTPAGTQGLKFGETEFPLTLAPGKEYEA